VSKIPVRFKDVAVNNYNLIISCTKLANPQARQKNPNYYPRVKLLAFLVINVVAPTILPAVPNPLTIANPTDAYKLSLLLLD